MHKQLLLAFGIVVTFISCQTPLPQNENKAATEIDTTPRITGIGGIFFASENPENLKQWYATNLGMKTDDYGSVFEFKNANKPNEINYLRWSLLAKNDSFLSPSKKELMINYRVYRIDELVKRMKQNGVVFTDTVSTYDYGKFIHLLDPEGNKIELWEPVDSVLTKMGGVTNK